MSTWEEVKSRPGTNVRFNPSKYDFSGKMRAMFPELKDTTPLSQLHTCFTKEQVFGTATFNYDTDTATMLHKRFYGAGAARDAFFRAYRELVMDVVLPLFKERSFAVQSGPSIRFSLPDASALGKRDREGETGVGKIGFHCDRNDGHPPGEINFILPITDMFESNGAYYESAPGKGDFKPINAKYGELFYFYGNACRHYNLKNVTGRTRISFDFRVVPMSVYRTVSDVKSSAAMGLKFQIGSYYRKVDKHNADDVTGDDDFAMAMRRVREEDPWAGPWQVVEKFERDLAAYTGAPFAIACDCCTNGMFMCLQYLIEKYRKASPGMNLPAAVIPTQTYTTVPAAIMHAGIECVFDRSTEANSWSGLYQLTPYPIFDSAVRFRKDMFKDATLRGPGLGGTGNGKFLCVSFHRKKRLAIGRGGMIFTDDPEAAAWLRMACCGGRDMNKMYDDDVGITVVGWNAYLTPEQAAVGLRRFEKLKTRADWPDTDEAGGYLDISQFPAYRGCRVIKGDRLSSKL